MATRCGGIDPHIPLFLLRSKRCSASELETILDQKSGLLGLSGISGDMRELKASKAPAAAAAIDHLVYHIVKFAGAYAAVLGGVDALVFTAGIGEMMRSCAQRWSPSWPGWEQSSTQTRTTAMGRASRPRTARSRCG